MEEGSLTTDINRLIVKTKMLKCNEPLLSLYDNEGEESQMQEKHVLAGLLMSPKPLMVSVVKTTLQASWKLQRDFFVQKKPPNKFIF